MGFLTAKSFEAPMQQPRQSILERNLLMKGFKEFVAIALCIVLLIFEAEVSASAFTQSAAYGNEAENAGDYAYWNGSKMIKSGTTTKEEVCWIQRMLNHCIKFEGLQAAQLTVDGKYGPASQATTVAFQKAAGLVPDGHFGPASIKKIKAVVNDGRGHSLLAATQTASNASSSKSSFTRQNILQVSASGSTKYISGNWYQYARGDCICCRNKYRNKYGEHEYIQGGGCGIVSLVSAVYNLGDTIPEEEIGSAIQDVLNWGYETKTGGGIRYWQNGVKSRNLFNRADDKFGAAYGFTITNEITGTSTDAKFVDHIRNGGTAIVHVYGHFMTVADCKTENGQTYFLVFDPAPGSGTHWNSTSRKNITKPEGTWISQSELKNDGGFKGKAGSTENVEIDAYWLVSAV